MTTVVTVDTQAILDEIVRAGDEAAQETRSSMRVPRRTGALAASIQVAAGLDADGDLAVVATSSLPYARAVDRGANVGPRPGPHMGGGAHFVGPALDALPDRIAEHVRSRS